MQQAWDQAQQQRIQSQLLHFANTVRGLKVQLMMADQAGELPHPAKLFLYRELAQCAAIVEVRE